VTLNLDFSAARAKLEWAALHIGTLHRETKRALAASKSYDWRAGEVDQETGWCSVRLIPQQVSDLRPSLVAGDIYHNLRSALDNAVTTLVEASGATLGRNHLFPICWSNGQWERNVGVLHGPTHSGGQLGGVTIGVREIQERQPMNIESLNQRAGHVLWVLEEFSNADKHRAVALFAGHLVMVPMVRYTGGGRILEVEPFKREVRPFHPQLDYEIVRWRFAKPFPVDVHENVELLEYSNAVFSTPPFDVRPGWLGHGTSFFEAAHKEVEATIDRLAAL
jgi:hypothetical protein